MKEKRRCTGKIARKGKEGIYFLPPGMNDPTAVANEFYLDCYGPLNGFCSSRSAAASLLLAPRLARF